MKVNGVDTEFATDAVLKGGGVKWFGWEDVHVANITLQKGENIIEMVVNYDSNAGKQTSGQGPFNVDYFYFKYL